MTRLSPRLAIVGVGRMGGALMQAWATNYPVLQPGEILAVDPSPQARDWAESLGCAWTMTPDRDTFFGLDTVVIGVKPQSLREAAEAVVPALPTDVLLISIAAGVRIETLQGLFPKARIVRAMPNTPAAYGAGATAYTPAPNVTEGQRARARALLEAGGVVEELADESLLDAVTAMSGSGPAYVYLLAEALAEAGVKEGLPRDVARRLATATVAGSGVLLSRKGADPKALREEVTSPGGTTEAALGILRASDGLYKLIETAVATAAWRAQELGR